MTPTIAERKIDIVLSDGKTGFLRVQIGRPVRDPDPKRDWYCPIRIRGMGKDRAHVFYGIDSLQALQMALCILDAEVRSFAGSMSLTCWGQKNLGLKPLILKMNRKSPTKKTTVRLRRP